MRRSCTHTVTMSPDRPQPRCYSPGIASVRASCARRASQCLSRKALVRLQDRPGHNQLWPTTSPRSPARARTSPESPCESKGGAQLVSTKDWIEKDYYKILG